MAWACRHYGEAWYQHREAIARLEKEIEEALGPEEEKLISKLGKHRAVMEPYNSTQTKGCSPKGKHGTTFWHILPSPRM